MALWGTFHLAVPCLNCLFSPDKVGTACYQQWRRARKWTVNERNETEFFFFSNILAKHPYKQLAGLKALTEFTKARKTQKNQTSHKLNRRMYQLAKLCYLCSTRTISRKKMVKESYFILGKTNDAWKWHLAATKKFCLIFGASKALSCAPSLYT